MSMFLGDDIYIDLDAIIEITMSDNEKGRVVLQNDEGERVAIVSEQTACDILDALRARQNKKSVAA
jgi:hypothetical protein